MPLVGLIDRKGKSIPWADIRKGKGNFEDPTPVLLALCGERTSYCDFSMTELMDDPYFVQMKRRYDYCESVDQLSDRLAGTSFHALMEKGGEMNGMEKEVKMSITLTVKGKKVTIGGTADLIQNRKRLWDYKTVTVGKLSRMSRGSASDAFESYSEQLNGYRYLFWKKTGVEINRLTIRFVVRDWRFYEFRRNGFDFKRYPRNLTHEVEPLPMEVIEKWITTRTAQHVAAERVSDDELQRVGECDTWNKLRCEHFCALNDVCWFRMQD